MAKFVVLLVGVGECLLAAFGVVQLGPVDTFKLGVAFAFASFLIPPRSWTTAP